MAMTCRIVLWIVFLVATTHSFAATVGTDDGRIREVTVYRDRAEVIREARVSVPGGASTVEFAGIPAGVETDSLRISAEGVPAVLGAVEIVVKVDRPAETPEYVAARDEVRRLEREIAEKSAEHRVDENLLEFLKSLQATTADSESKNLGNGRSDPQAISAFYDLLAEKLGSLAMARVARKEADNKLREELDLAKAKLNTSRPAGDIRSRVAAVELEAARSGTLTLRLAYVVPRAMWYPSYRATLDAKTGNVNWVGEGVVRQSTGEDWTGVKMSLSTASPAQGVEPPFLTSRILRPAELRERVTLGRSQGAPMEIESDRLYQNTLSMAPGVAEPTSERAATSQASLIKSAYNVAFSVPGTSEVPADGRDHRVVLRNETLQGNLVHRTVPGMSSRAYLTSVTTSPADYPLLAGTVRVFAEGAYLGRFPLKETGPGLEFTVPFGVDNRLEVIRVKLPKSAGKQGLGGRQREIEYAYRTQLHNLQDRPVTLVMEDRIPVAEDERIVVELDEKQTSPGFKDSPRRPGVKLLTLELEPGEKTEINFAYRVRHPRELAVMGLE